MIAARHLHCEADLIDSLADPDPIVSLAARMVLVRLSRGTDFGPFPDAKPKEREAAIKQWRDWWAQQEAPPDIGPLPSPPA